MITLTWNPQPEPQPEPQQEPQPEATATATARVRATAIARVPESQRAKGQSHSQNPKRDMLEAKVMKKIDLPWKKC